MRRRNVKSKTYVKDLWYVFSPSLSKELRKQIIRLSVLFEDLRIEAAGSLIDERLDDMDKLSTDYRRFYFVRRAIATLQEFSSAMNVLNGEKEFRSQYLEKFEPEDRKRWDETIQFFTANRRRLKNVRNDVGGHFGDAAAAHVADLIEPESISKLEFETVRPGEAIVILHFASVLATAALTRDRASTETYEDYIGGLFTFVADAFGKALQAVYLITTYFFLPRF